MRKASNNSVEIGMGNLAKKISKVTPSCYDLYGVKYKTGGS